MKKLLSIVISAITLGVFADAGNTPMTFELPEGLAAGTEVSLVCNGEVVHTTTTTSASITYSTEGLAAGEYWLELAGEPITESLMIGASASAPQFASAKFATITEGEITVGKQLTWSNAQFVGQDGYSVAGGDYSTPKLLIPAEEGLPAGTVLRIDEISFAKRSDKASTVKNFLLVGSQTDTTKASEQVVVDETNTLGGQTRYTYTFTENAVNVTVGATATSMYFQTTAGSGNESTQLQVVTKNADNTTVYQDSGFASWCIIHELKATVVSFPARDPIAFTFDASTQTWNEELPEEFMIGDTIVYTGTGDATISSNVTVPLTVGAGVNLTISGDVNITGVSKFESGSTLTIASGTTTISNAQNGSNGDRGLMGTVIVEAGATLALPKNDSINYSGATEMHVKGTLALGTNRQSLRAHNKLYVYPGSSITGNGDGNTALDFVDGSEVGLTVVDDEEVADKTATISAVVRNNNAANNILIDVPTGMTLTMSGVIKQGVPKKLGAGDLILSGANTFTKLEVAAGTVKNGKTSGIPSGLGAYSGGNQCDNLSLITVAEGAKLDVANIAGGGYGSCYRIELAGELTNTGADMGTDWRQLSKITVTGDNAKITGNTESLLCSGYAATKLELGEHTLEIALNANKIIHLRTTTISGTGTIKITSGQLHITDDTSLAEEADITVLVAEGASFDDGLNIFPEANVKALDSVNNKIVKNGCVYSTAARDVATTIYVTSNTSTFVDAEGNSINPIAADTIVVDSHCTIGQWGGGINLSQLPACAELVLNRHMDVQGGIADDANVTVAFKNGGNEGVYLHGNIGAGATIGGEGNLFVGYSNATCTIGDGVTISCGFGFQTGKNHTAIIDGDVEISSTIIINSGTIKLNAEATLTTPELSDSTKVTTDVADSHVEYNDGVYAIVADSTGPTTWEEVTTADFAETDLAGISSEGLTALKAWAQSTGNVAIDDIASINVNCFLMGVENSETDPELKITADDLAKILAAESLEAAAAALKDTYPNATVTIKDVTTKICGEGATNTHLYQLELSLPTAQN